MEHLSKTVFRKTRHCYSLPADVTIVLFQAVSGISSAYQEYMYGHPYPSPYVCRWYWHFHIRYCWIALLCSVWVCHHTYIFYDVFHSKESNGDSPKYVLLYPFFNGVIWETNCGMHCWLNGWCFRIFHVSNILCGIWFVFSSMDVYICIKC